MKKDVQLKNVKPYQDGYGHWFLKLVYTYEDEDGTHEFTYPKVDLPFDQASIPYHFEVPTDDNFFIEQEKVIKETWASPIIKGEYQNQGEYNIERCCSIIR